jgi:hypothetical protein
MRSDHTPNLPSAVPAILVGVATATILTLASLTTTFDAPDASKATLLQAQGFRALVLWAISFSAFFTVMFWNAIFALRVIRAYAGRVIMNVTKALVSVSMISAAILSILNWSRSGLLSIVIKVTGIRFLHQITMAGNVLAAECTILIVMACVALASRHGHASPLEIRRRDTDARRLLFSTAAFLAVGLAEMYLVLTWASSIQSASSSTVTVAPGVLEHISQTIAMAAALFYTGVLAALFGPLSIIHSAWLDEAWEEDTGKPPGQTRSEWLSVNGLDKSFLTMAMQVGAVIAPWLLGLIKSLAAK